jgi:hypothetical protein
MTGSGWASQVPRFPIAAVVTLPPRARAYRAPQPRSTPPVMPRSNRLLGCVVVATAAVLRVADFLTKWNAQISLRKPLCNHRHDRHWPIG